MTDDASRYSSLHASDRALRERLIQLPRRSKQLLMLATDAAGFFGCLVLCGWLQLIDPVFRTSWHDFWVSTIQSCVTSAWAYWWQAPRWPSGRPSYWR